MSVAAHRVTLSTTVHLRWRTADPIEAAVWRNAAELAGARPVHLYRHEDGSGYTLTLEVSVGAALTRLRYTPRFLAEVAFGDSTAHVRRLQDLYWVVWLPRHAPQHICFN
ncbi:MAG TPA: hypothetical protein VHJ69_09500 [Gemmatimonadales bacterium]|jgi:hypothetical protein|nr:hypothetical protein [Gemmatimonadales bacterium]